MRAEIVRAIARHRRLVAALCTAAAVLAALDALSPAAPARVTVVGAARDIAAGTTLAPADLEALTLPKDAVPDGAILDVRSAVGSTTTGALRRGETLTDVRVGAGSLHQPGPGLVAAPVRFADPDAAALLEPGEHIDVLAASTSTAEPANAAAAIVAADVRVIDIPHRTAAASADPAIEGALVVLATTPAQARALAQAEVIARLSAIVVS